MRFAHLSRGVAAAVVCGALITPAAAQDSHSSEPITITVPYVAGGGTDAVARCELPLAERCRAGHQLEKQS
ncbi:hypothetical protein [Marinivivus vitaminiproducens]|uniref:hypothetical protein n=1 Tax=Marinivivus vitaminiproducens TaxID=3035935 RepID=UPI00279DFFF0|nr:hypothetical protein P4R82_20380 [Geminicoccaceae bacterium SCSIO 64248]